jgi:hypothetical protein
MKLAKALFQLSLLALMAGSSLAASPDGDAPAAPAGKASKKKIVYQSHTQIDLTGETVQGKVRAPEVFYVFQRKRAEAHHVVKPPEDFNFHHDAEVETLRREVSK